MSRTPDQVQSEVGTLLPDGWAWNHAPSSNLMRSFAGFARSVADFEAAAEAQLFESEPDTTEALLDDYERVIGPDTCLGDPSLLTFDERRQSVSARWIYPADASVAGLVALAASYGVAVTITEVRRNCAGVMRAGTALRSHPQQFVWIVGMPAARVIPFIAGAAKAGDPLGKIERNTQVECVLRRAAPAHTAPVFNYAGA